MQQPKRFSAILLSTVALTGCDVLAPTGIGTIPGMATSDWPTASVPSTGTWSSPPPAAPTAKLPPASAGSSEAAIRPFAEKYAATYDLPVGLVLAVIARESAFKPTAVSKSGAQGLMQLMPGTITHIRSAGGPMILDPFDPEQNVAGGCWYLRWVRGQVPDAKVAEADGWRFALAGYNAGIGRVQSEVKKALAGAPVAPRASWDTVGPALPAETRGYVPAVMTTWQTYGTPGGWGRTK